MGRNDAGREPIVIDWTIVEGLCKIQCTGEEIASIIGVDYDTLNTAIKREHDSSFSDYFKKHSAGGKASLRRVQFDSAVNGKVPSMMIWLGKQHLGQKEKNEITGQDGGPIDLSVHFIKPEDV